MDVPVLNETSNISYACVIHPWPEHALSCASLVSGMVQVRATSTGSLSCVFTASTSPATNLSDEGTAGLPAVGLNSSPVDSSVEYVHRARSYNIGHISGRCA